MNTWYQDQECTDLQLSLQAANKNAAYWKQAYHDLLALHEASKPCTGNCGIKRRLEYVQGYGQ